MPFELTPPDGRRKKVSESVVFPPVSVACTSSVTVSEPSASSGITAAKSHAKDALVHDDGTRQEVPLGEGDVGMETFLRTLDGLGYDGPLTIEREIPQEPERQKEEIGGGMRLLEEIKAKLA